MLLARRELLTPAPKGHQDDAVVRDLNAVDRPSERVVVRAIIWVSARESADGGSPAPRTEPLLLEHQAQQSHAPLKVAEVDAAPANKGDGEVDNKLRHGAFPGPPLRFRRRFGYNELCPRHQVFGHTIRRGVLLPTQGERRAQREVNRLPTYGYQCTVCRHEFSVFQSMKDDPIASCTECGAPVKRLLYPVGVVFKGSGWYINDSRKPDPKESAPVETATESGSADTKKTETKSDSAPSPQPSSESSRESAREPAPKPSTPPATS